MKTVAEFEIKYCQFLDAAGNLAPGAPPLASDTGELLNLLADWAPQAADRHQILVESPDRLFFAQ